VTTEIRKDDNSLQVNTENTQFEVNSNPDLQIRDSSGQYSAANEWQSIKGTAAEQFASLRKSIPMLIEQNKSLLTALGWVLLGFIGLRVLFALISAINDIPLVPLILELIGLSYVVWFTYRYLLTADARQEFGQKVDQIKQNVMGQQSFGSSSGMQTGMSGQSMPGQSRQSGKKDNKTGLNVKKTVLIQKSPEELYQFWRNFENLPHFMSHLKSVQVMDDKRSHWVAKAPLDTDVEWDAEIIDEVPNKTIVWRSLPGAEVSSVGSVAFTSANGSGTEVKVTMEYKPPGGVLGAAAAALFGENPQQQLDEDLQRFKQLMETGAVA
jgi:uncharacterized membrane protein